MIRSVKISLKFITEEKRHKIASLLEAYRAGVNFYIKSVFTTRGKLDKETLARLPSNRTRLSERYKSQALKQALEIVIDTKKAAKAQRHPCGVPFFKGPATLDAKFVTIEEGRGSFDLVIKLSTLCKYQRVILPTRKTKVLNKWLSIPLAKLIQGCSLSENSLILFVEFPDLPTKEKGRTIGIDLGINKLISTSDGNHFGREFKTIRDKIKNRKPKSKARYRSYQERTNYINRTINQLPWDEISVLGVENLHDMKRGKKHNRSKAFRKALAPWVYRQVINRISNKAQENRVRLVAVDPANTSRTCPICGVVSKDSRRGEDFVCISCGHKADADSVGASNVLTRTLLLLGSLESPGQS